MKKENTSENKQNKSKLIVLILLVLLLLAVGVVGVIHGCTYLNKDDSGSQRTTHDDGETHYYLVPLVDSSYVTGEMACICVELTYNKATQLWQATKLVNIYNDKFIYVNETIANNHNGYDANAHAEDNSWSADYHSKMFNVEVALESESDIFILTDAQNEAEQDLTRSELTFYKLTFCNINTEHTLDEEQIGNFISEAMS